MIISTKHKYIFISVPKTGSQTIRDFLLKVDETAKWNSFILDGRSFFCREHATAKEIQNIIGEKYDQFRVISFIRNPLKKTVSGYFFYRGGDLMGLWKSNNDRKFFTAFNIVIAKLLPFKIWALLKSVKTNSEYLKDQKGCLIVSHVGRTENLDTDFARICNELNLPFNLEKLERKNTSKYNRKKDFIGEGVFRYLLERKYKDDIEFYNSLM